MRDLFAIAKFLFCHAMLCISAACGVRLSVCLFVFLSVTFVNSVKTSQHIFNFLPSGSETILVFSYQTSWQYSDGDPLTGASNAGGVGTNRDFRPISGYRIDDCWS